MCSILCPVSSVQSQTVSGVHTLCLGFWLGTVCVSIVGEVEQTVQKCVRQCFVRCCKLHCPVQCCILLRAYYGDYDSAVAVAVAAQFGWKRYRFTTHFRDHVGFSYLLFACQYFPVLVATSRHLHHHNCVWTRLLGSFSAPVFSTVCRSVSVCLWRAHLMACQERESENCAETPSSFFLL